MSDSASNGGAVSGTANRSDGADARASSGSEYRSTISIGDIAALLNAAKRPLLLSHAKPDGDALGSLLALHRACANQGAAPTILLMGPIEPSLIEAAGDTPTRRFESDGHVSEEPDLIVVVDTGAWAQLEPLAAWLRERAERVVGIDHHARGDDVAPRRIIDATCASTTQMIVEVVDAMGVAITPPIADALFMGLATDTGWFRFSSADHRVFALASRLLKAGADKDHLYAVLEQALRPPQLALQARALTSMTLLGDGRAAVMRLGVADFVAAGASPGDTGGIVNDPLALRSVRVSVLLTEHEPGVTRISFRSKPPTSDASGVDGDSIDVNELASRIGGGGHRHAAGARLELPIAEAVERVEGLLTSVL